MFITSVVVSCRQNPDKSDTPEEGGKSKHSGAEKPPFPLDPNLDSRSLKQQDTSLGCTGFRRWAAKEGNLRRALCRPSAPSQAPSFRRGNQGSGKPVSQLQSGSCCPKLPLPTRQAPVELTLRAPCPSPGDVLTCLPPGVHQRAPAVPHHSVQPLPGLVVDRLPHCSPTRERRC